MPLRPGTRRYLDPRFTLVRSPWSTEPITNSASRLRLARDGIEAGVAEVRAWFASQGRERFTWWVGSSATPRDLLELLLHLGASRHDAEPVFAAMVLQSEPAHPHGVDIRRVDTFGDFRTMREIYAAAFATSAQARAETEARQAEMWEHSRTVGREQSFLALLDGEPVAAGTLALTEAGPALLMGGATLPEARGRGCYRALVRARWDEAVRLGASGLAVGAGKMSRPILERLGFRAVGEVCVLEDSSR
jgi:GNAT superfamily N-acetyltransferase